MSIGADLGALYVDEMDSRRLTADQIERLRMVIDRQARYPHRLVNRMTKLKWREDDPLWVTALRASQAVDSLARELVVRRKPGGRLP